MLIGDELLARHLQVLLGAAEVPEQAPLVEDHLRSRGALRASALAAVLGPGERGAVGVGRIGRGEHLRAGVPVGIAAGAEAIVGALDEVVADAHR